MAELTEKQLLMLDSLMYIGDAMAPGKSMEQVIEAARNNLNEGNIGGGMTVEEAKILLNDIEKDDALMSLKVTDYKDTAIRAACFVNPKTNEAVIAYRGTGPAYVAWDDNCQGGYLSDTDLQKEALEFAQECAVDYDNITVTGHSKGGNMAQYVTVLMGNQIDRCVSFDGQGFGDDFFEKYSDEIEANKHKIRSVCAHNDYVNILLTPLVDEDEIVYLANDEEIMPGGHHIFDIYNNSKNVLNEKGEYITSQKQNWLIRLLNNGEEYLVDQIGKLGLTQPFTEFLIYSVIGAIMGGILGEDADIKKIIDEFLNNFMDYVEYYLERWTSGNTNMACNMTVDTSVMREYGDDLNRAADLLDQYQDQIRRLKRKMADNIVDGIAIGLPLTVVIQQLETECNKLQKLARFLDSSAEAYDSAELKAKQFAQ